jgi:hypothetical protein
MVTSRTAYVVALPDLPGGGGPATAAEQLAVDLEHVALDWLDADAVPGEMRLAGRQQRLSAWSSRRPTVSWLQAGCWRKWAWTRMPRQVFQMAMGTLITTPR